MQSRYCIIILECPTYAYITCLHTLTHAYTCLHACLHMLTDVYTCTLILLVHAVVYSVEVTIVNQLVHHIVELLY